MLEAAPPGVVLLVYLLVQGVFITDVETARRCYVCGPGDYQEECKDPETNLLPLTCMTNARYCSITMRRRTGEVTYLSRECAETCHPVVDPPEGEGTQEDQEEEEGQETLLVSCCKGDGCNHGNTINMSTTLSALITVAARWVLRLL